MLSFDVPAFLLAFLITLVEMTEVVALVFALSAESTSVRHGGMGAAAGTAVVGAVAVGFSAALIALPHEWLLIGSSVALAAFGVFVFRSTLKAYRRARAASAGAPPPAPRGALLFAGGFTVGAVEATEAVIVLVALAAAGHPLEAIVGALTGGLLLIVAAALVHERIRRIKVPTLKLGACALLFAFAVFWTGEAAGVPWPGADLILVPLFLVGVVAVRGGVQLVLGPAAPPVHAKG